MSKTSKIMLVVGMGLICIGIILSLVTSNSIIDSILNSSASLYEQKEKEFSIEELENIIIDTDNKKIVIVPTLNDKVKVTYYESKNQKYNFEQYSDTIKIKQDYKITFFNFDFNLNRNLKIEIPQDLILNYNIKTSNAKVEIENLNVEELIIKTSNGGIVLNDIFTTNNIILKTSNASINLKNVDAYTVDMRSTNGRLSIDNVEVFEIIGKTSNSSIEINNLVAENFIKMNTTNGRIKFDNLNSSNINMTTSNGRISGNIEGSETDYKKDIKTSNSKITINGINYGSVIKDSADKLNYLYLKTSNDSINVNIK